MIGLYNLLDASSIDVVIVKKDSSGKGPAYVFSDANVEVLLTEEEKPVLAIEKNLV